jgi:hypothetical protein
MNEVEIHTHDMNMKRNLNELEIEYKRIFTHNEEKSLPSCEAFWKYTNKSSFRLYFESLSGTYDYNKQRTENKKQTHRSLMLMPTRGNFRSTFFVCHSPWEFEFGSFSQH